VGFVSKVNRKEEEDAVLKEWKKKIMKEAKRFDEIKK
jgi:uncharacterized protein (UPF0335 family)